MPESVDVAIVGGGVMGCAIAWQLAKNGVSCALVERGAFGGGASGATAGVVGPLWHIDPDDPDMWRLGARSLELFPQWAAELSEAGVNPEFQQGGVLRLAFSQAPANPAALSLPKGRPSSEDDLEELSRLYHWQSELGLGVQWLEPGEVRRREPHASGDIRAGVFSPQEGCVRGQRLCDALAHAAGRLGARLYEHTEVTGLHYYGNRTTGVETTVGPIAAGQVVLAAGPSTGIGGRWAMPGGPLDLPVRGVKGQRILLRLPGFMPLCPVRNSRVYVVPRLDGNILVASTREEGRSDEMVTAEGIATLVAGAVRSFPILSDAAFVGGRAGVRPATPDGRPIIGPVPGAEGLTIVTGHDAVGIMLSPGTAELVTQYILDGNEAPLRAFRADRFA